jgi:CHASE2 domain-containing sensor protein/signal transduction histidine kinase
VAALLLVFNRSTERLDRLVYDTILSLESHEPDPRILLVTIDQDSLEEIGAWPWPRETHARLIEALARGKPKAIAYDILFLDKKPGDDRIAAAAANVPLYLPMLFDVPGRNGNIFDAVLPQPVISKAAAGLGHVNLMVDGDGVVRRIRRFDGAGQERWPHLMELMRRMGQPGQSKWNTGDMTPQLIPFAGPAGHFPSITAAAILRGEFPPEIVNGRLILVGANAQGLGDHYPTALTEPGGIMPGVEIQANFLDGMLSGRMIQEANIAVQSAFALLPLWLMLTGFIRLRPRGVIALVIVLAITILSASAGALLLFHQWVPPMPAMLTLGIVHPLWGWRRLAAVNSYMIGELEILRAAPQALLPLPEAPSATDHVSRHAMLLSGAITQTLDMRRFVTDSLNQLPDAVLVVDEEGRTLLSNTAADTLIDQYMPQGDQDLSILIGSLKAAAEETATEESQEPIVWPPVREETRQEMLLPDGTCMNLRILERFTANGARSGWIVRMSDVTATWTARQEREETLRFLSHDMRSPLASILALTSTASPEKLSPGLGGRLAGYARRSLELADGFIHLARAQTIRIQPSPLNLSDLLKDAIDDLWPQISARQITVLTEGENDEIHACGERTLLTRALINLIDNAVKYGRPEGSIKCALRVKTVTGRPMAVFEISDDGPGMPPDLTSRLFERFERGEEQSAHGAGLGLSFVRVVAQRHDGTISCESDVGKGTTFVFMIPVGDKLEFSEC